MNIKPESVKLPVTCGKCSKMGGVMCLDKRVHTSLALTVIKRDPPPEWCPIRKDIV